MEDIEIENENQEESVKIILQWDGQQYHDENYDYKKLSLYISFPDLINFIISNYLFSDDWCCFYHDDKHWLFSPSNYFFFKSSQVAPQSSADIFSQMKKYSFNFQPKIPISILRGFKVKVKVPNSSHLIVRALSITCGFKDDFILNFNTNTCENRRSSNYAPEDILEFPKSFVKQLQSLYHSSAPWLDKISTDNHYIAFYRQDFPLSGNWSIGLRFLNSDFEDQFDDSVQFPDPFSNSEFSVNKFHFFRNDLYCFTISGLVGEVICHKLEFANTQIQTQTQTQTTQIEKCKWRLCSSSASCSIEKYGDDSISLRNGRYLLFYRANELFDLLTFSWLTVPWKLPISLSNEDDNENYFEMMVTRDDILTCMTNSYGSNEHNLWILDTREFDLKTNFTSSSSSCLSLPFSFSPSSSPRSWDLLQKFDNGHAQLAFVI